MGPHYHGSEGMVMKSKKGFFFTLLTIFMLGIFIFYFTQHSFHRASAKKEVVEKRILSIDDFLQDVKRDLSRGLYISGYRAILATNEFLINHHAFIKNAETTIKEGVMNGTINETDTVLLDGSTFGDWVEKITFQGKKQNIFLNVSVNELSVYQEDPWLVTLAANVSLFVADELQTSVIRQNEVIAAKVSVLGFEDPLYIINGRGRLTNVINKTSFDNNYTYQVDGKWNVSNLLKHAYEGYYIDNADAPAFLQRFSNNMSPSLYGIESLVDLAEFTKQGLAVYDHALVDHYYFINASTVDYNINYTPSWFKIDEGHRDKYMVTGISYVAS